MKNIVALICGIAVLASCQVDSNRSVEEYFSAFLQEDAAIIAFGSAELNTILQKSDYENLPKVGAGFKEPISKVQSVLNLDEPVYYAIQGPFINSNPKAVYIFAEVKNEDSLRTALLSNGFSFQEKDGVEYIAEGDMSMIVQNNMALMTIKNEKYEPSKILGEAVKKTQGDFSEEKVEEIIGKKGDIVLAMDVHSLYATSNTDLEKLPKDKKEKIERMLKNSYVENSIKFKDGAVVIESRNDFSDELNKHLFFVNDKKAPVVAKLGKGQPRMGISVNLDLQKAQDFVEEFSPNAMQELAKGLGGEFSAALFLAGNDLSKVFDGQLGLVMFSNEEMEEEYATMAPMIPEFNFYIGLEDKGKSIAGMAKDMLASQFAELNVSDNSIAGFTSADFVPNDAEHLSLPETCEDFGKKSISAFLYLDDLDMSSFDLEGEAKLLELVKSVNFNYDNTGGEFIIQAKDGKENALKQAVKKILKELEKEVAGV